MLILVAGLTLAASLGPSLDQPDPNSWRTYNPAETPRNYSAEHLRQGLDEHGPTAVLHCADHQEAVARGAGPDVGSRRRL